MGDVINLQRYKEEQAPHMAGPAHCMCCKHEWAAVAPVGTVFLECPECLTEKGVFLMPVLRGNSEWTCNCGNTLFKISPDNGAYCPNCGQTQQGW
jgi:hypothetical protein